jgi:hypothetical protein
VQRALDEAPAARAAIEAVLRHNARTFSDPQKPHGCMIVLSSLTGGKESAETRRFLSESRRRSEEALRRRMERGIAEGDLLPSADPAPLAAYVTTVLHGLSVQARDGATRATLDAISDCAMACWDRLTGR